MFSTTAMMCSVVGCAALPLGAQRGVKGRQGFATLLEGSTEALFAQREDAKARKASQHHAADAPLV